MRLYFEHTKTAVSRRVHLRHIVQQRRLVAAADLTITMHSAEMGNSSCTPIPRMLGFALGLTSKIFSPGLGLVAHGLGLTARSFGLATQGLDLGLDLEVET